MNISIAPNADSVMASNFPRLYMAITALKIIFVLIIIFVMYKLNTSSARDRAAQETQRIINLRNAQLAAPRSGQHISLAQGFRGY